LRRAIPAAPTTILSGTSWRPRRHLYPDERQRAHLDEIEQALERIGAALEQAQNPGAGAMGGEFVAPRLTAPCSGQDLSG
jgi:hypothetical protein